MKIIEFGLFGNLLKDVSVFVGLKSLKMLYFIYIDIIDVIFFVGFINL